MRIALRPSGGRGEYELAGSQGNINVSNLFDHHIILELTPGNQIPSGNIARRVQGKPRIRLQDRRNNSHLYLTLAAALLLPKPIRELRKTPSGKLQIIENKYAVTSIQFDIVNVAMKEIIIRPTDLVISNISEDAARVSIIERMRILLDVWAISTLKNDLFSTYLQNHKEAFRSGNAASLEKIAQQIRQYLSAEDDPLREIVRYYNLSDQFTYWMGIHHKDIELAIREEDQTNPREAAKERVKEWRLQASRDSKGAKFREDVNRAYEYTCLFTGYYLPKIPLTGSAGVDAAHILPWAEYNINSVSNGICLSKLCHWAFDAGILRLDHDSSRSRYILSIPTAIKNAEQDTLIDLSAFHHLEGPIPQDRFPIDRSLWPDPKYIEIFNQDTTGE